MKYRFKPLQIFHKPTNLEMRKTSKSKTQGRNNLQRAVPSTRLPFGVTEWDLW